MVHGSECWKVYRNIEQRMGVVEKKTSRRLSGMTSEDEINNEYIRGTIDMDLIVDKMKGKRLRGLRYIIKREET